MTSLSKLLLGNKLDTGAEVTVAADRGQLFYVVTAPAGRVTQHREEYQMAAWDEDAGPDGDDA